MASELEMEGCLSLPLWNLKKRQQICDSTCAGLEKGGCPARGRHEVETGSQWQLPSGETPGKERSCFPGALENGGQWSEGAASDGAGER